MWKDYSAHRQKTVAEGTYYGEQSLGKNWLLPKLENKKLSKITNQDWQDCVDAMA